MIQDTPFMRALLTMETTEIHTAILNKMKERGEISNHFICLRHGYCHIHGSNRKKVMEYCKRARS